MPRINYSRHARQMLAERNIEADWVTRTIEAPDSIEEDPLNPEIKRAFLKIPENQGRVLRVVYAGDSAEIRIITAFFDRRRRTRAE